jgi:hypothetical protein
VLDHLLKNPRDPAHIDLMLNTSRWTVAECVEMILDALRRLESRATPPGK